MPRYKKERKKAQGTMRASRYQEFLNAESSGAALLRRSLGELEPFHWHSYAAQEQRAYYENLFENFPENEVLWHFDFKQNIVILKGPKEGSSWWYANCRVEYTVFGVLVAQRVPAGVETMYYTMASTVLEKVQR